MSSDRRRDIEPEFQDRYGNTDPDNASSAESFLIFGVILAFIFGLGAEGWMVPVMFIGVPWLIVLFYIILMSVGAKNSENARFQYLKNETEKTLQKIEGYNPETEEKIEFSLYLRSFACDTLEYDVPYLTKDGVEAIKSFPIDNFVLDINQCRAVICVGNNDKSVGVGNTIFEDDEWKNKVRLFIDISNEIFIVPSPPTPGLIWEFKTIVEMNMLHKTFIVLPKNIEKPFVNGWGKFKQEVKEFLPFPLPMYEKNGMLIDFIELGDNIIMRKRPFCSEFIGSKIFNTRDPLDFSIFHSTRLS